MDNSTLVKETGRLRYIEPTNIGVTSSYGETINFPYEDYCISVDLSVLLADRYSCGWAEELGEIKEISYSSRNGSLSFLGGSKVDESDTGFLSTKFTDISMTSPSTNTSECLGIESIDITYGQWMFPTVDIKFIDVRGASVMMPSEDNYYNTQEKGSAINLYKALFTFPYPLFILKVKGFYGKGVTYKIVPTKTSLEINSETGNFNITTTFIGHMYGIYADMPITYLAIAPYTEDGSKYWDSKISDGTFRFRDSSGVYRTNMIKFPELRKKLAEAAANEVAISAAAEGKEVLDNIDEQASLLRNIEDTFPFKKDTWLFNEKNQTFYTIAANKDSVKEIINSISGFVDTVKSYDETYSEVKGAFSNVFSSLNEYIDVDVNDITIEYTQIGNTDRSEVGKDVWSWDNNQSKYEENIRPFENVKTFIDETARKKSFLTNFYVVFIKTNTADGYSGFFYGITGKDNEKNLLKSLSDKKSAKEKEYKEKEMAVIEKILGFRPSIKNLFNLVFAHMETFMHCFYDMTKEIRNELYAGHENRQKTTYGLKNGDTDTEYCTESTSLTDSANALKNRAKFLPPFFAYYKDEEDGNQKKKSFVWPGKLTEATNRPDFWEVDFVKKLINGSEQYKLKDEEITDYIKSLSGVTTNGYQTTNQSIRVPNTSITSFIPLSTYDFIYKEEMGNPYFHIRELLQNDTSNINNEVLGAFALRMFYYLASNGNDDNNEAYAYGVLDAINLYKAVGDNYSEPFINFIKKYADDKGNNKDANGFIDIVTKNSSNKPWNFNSNNSLFSVQGDNFIYSLIGKEDGGYLPLGKSKFTDIKDDFSKKKLTGNKNYISTTKFWKVNSDEKDNLDKEVQTFFIIESKDYISTIYDNIENEYQTTKESLAANNEGYKNRNRGEYGEIIKGNRTLKAYKNNIEDKFGEKCYDGDTLVTSTGDGIDKIGRRGASKVMTGDVRTQMDYYIKYPSKVDEKEDVSIFGHSLYKQQTTNEAKAYLFLQSLPIRGYGETGNIEENNTNGLSLKAILLREGSYYWWEDYVWEDGEFHADRFKSKGYKYPNANETFISDSVENNYETLLPKEGDGPGGYNTWKIPNGCTYSRKKVLKQMFLDWANGTGEYDFGGNCNRLSDVSLYSREKNLLGKEKEESTRNLNNGLDINLVISDGHKKDNEEARALQKFLRDLFFSVYTTLDLYDGVYNYEVAGININTFKCSIKKAKNAFKGFMDELSAIYNETAKEAKNNPAGINRMRAEEEANNPFKNDDLRLSTYMTLKNLYDKWLCGPQKGPLKTWTLDPKIDSDFNNFIYIDTFYNKIGDKLTANVTKVSSWLSSCLPTSNLESTEGVMTHTGKTVYDFLTSVAQDSGGMLLALPHKFGMNTSQNMVDMFTPMPLYSNWDDDSSTYVFMYTYKPSEHLGDDDSGQYDMNGWSPTGDSFNLTKSELMGEVFNGSDENGYVVPGFGVTYAKQNQSMFKNIGLNAENHGATEAGIAATLNIASKSSESPRETSFYGQDIYSVFSKMAFKCSVESMGNMQITPLMYFQLNNIPLWKGAYMILKVSHSITAGNMTTNFEGVRVNRHAIPLSSSVALTLKDTGNHDSENGGEVTYGSSGGGTGGEETNEQAQPNFKVPDSIDYNENNVSPFKPVICLTPAHGPETQKSEEWAWSTKVVDKIMEILSGYKYSDGTPYNIQRCNKNGKYTNKGYSMTETRNIIKKHGSNSVISVVPHWNGGSSDYYLVMLDYTGRERKDSIKLAECMVGEVKKFKEEWEGKCPSNAMNGGFKIKPYNEAVGRAPNPQKDDGACRLNCACILTENWFRDYPNAKYEVQGWLEDEKTIESLAMAHANAIKKYIDQLT